MELKSTLGGDYNFGEVEKKKLVIAGFDGVALRANLAFTKVLPNDSVQQMKE